MTPERIAELLNYVGLQLADFRDGELADLLATAEREARLREAVSLLLPIVADAICHGMPITQQVADARNKAIAALEPKGGET